MRYIRLIKFYILNKLFRINLNKEYKLYTIYYLDGSKATMYNEAFKTFGNGIIEKLYNSNKCYIKVTKFGETEQ